MDSSMMPFDVAIAGYGAVTGLGCGVRRLEEAVMNNSSALRPCASCAGRGYQSDVAAMISEASWDEVGSLSLQHSGSRVWRLAVAAATEAKRGVEELWTRVSPERMAFVLSTTKADIMALESALRESAQPPDSGRHIQPAALGADLADAFKIRGPVQCVSLACTSGVMALQQGCSLIRRNQADMVLVVGVDIISHFVLSGFSSLKSLDPQGCRPFDAERKGLSLGEGAGAIVLVRAGLQKPGDPIIRGGGSSNDANHLTGPSRDGSGLALAIVRALSSARLSAQSIDYVNAHGTGTVYNDAMESLALRKVFGDNVPPFSAQKGMFGHTLGSAGIIETIICCIAGRTGVLPGTPGLKVRDPAVPPSVLDLPVHGRFPRHILKINSGFGGINGAIVMEMRAG